MKKPFPVYKSNRKRRRISSIHGQGFKKSILEVNVISPGGRRRTVAWSEDPHPGVDRRQRKPSPEWLTICNLGRSDAMRADLRINLKTGQPSIRIWGHSHREYFPLSWEAVTALQVVTSNYQVSNKLDGSLTRRWVEQKISRRRKYLYSRLYPGKRGSK